MTFCSPVVRRRFGWTILVAGLAAVLALPLVWAEPAGPRQEIVTSPWR